MKTRSIFLLLTVALSLFSCNEEYPELEDGMYAEFKTSMGPVVAELYFEETPMTVASFVSLAEGTSEMVDSTYKGKKYYDGLIFHRVIDGFVIQGGDPTGTGSGGPGYKFPDEFVDTLSHDEKGILSMANAGPGTNGSQFFITLGPVQQLDPRHTVFGKVVKGLDVVESIGKVETGPRDRPVEDVVMKEVKIIRKGSAAKDFKAPKVMENELAEMEAEKEAQAQKAEEMKAEKSQEFAALEDKADSLDSGLKIYFENEGDGEEPKSGQKINVLYEGYFADGTIFDTNKEDIAKEAGIYSEQRAAQGGYGKMPMQYGPDAPMIPGFKEGLQQMQVGDKAVIWIPSHLGYGERGAGGVIPPNTDLIFRLEITGMAGKTAFKTENQEKVAKAAISAIMNVDQKIINTSRESENIYQVYYNKEGKKSYDVQINANSIVWRNQGGRWRTHSQDPKITFEKMDGNVKIIQTFPNGETIEKDKKLIN